MRKSARVGIKPPAPAVSFQCGWGGPRDRFIMETYLSKSAAKKLSLPRVTLPIRASDSANVRQRRPRHETPALDHGRVAARNVSPFWSTKIISTNSSDGIVKRNCRPNCKMNCKAELPVELSDRQSSCQSNCRVAYCTDCVQFCWILLKTHWLNVNWTLMKLYKVFLFIFSSLVFSHYGR